MGAKSSLRQIVWEMPHGVNNSLRRQGIAEPAEFFVGGTGTVPVVQQQQGMRPQPLAEQDAHEDSRPSGWTPALRAQARQHGADMSQLPACDGALALQQGLWLHWERRLSSRMSHLR